MLILCTIMQTFFKRENIKEIKKSFTGSENTFEIEITILKIILILNILITFVSKAFQKQNNNNFAFTFNEISQKLLFFKKSWLEASLFAKHLSKMIFICRESDTCYIYKGELFSTSN